MSPELVELVLGIGAIVTGVVGVGAHQYRKRNGKSLPPPEQTVVHVQPDASPADDTSRLAALVKDAPASEVQQLIHVMKESIEQRPATQGDVTKAIDDGIQRMRRDINGHFRTTDAAVVDLRHRFADLPCVRRETDDCPEADQLIQVPVKQ